VGTFEVDGIVVQVGSSGPIEGIRVQVLEEATTTGADGTWALEGLYAGEEDVMLYALDLDGESGGGLFTLTLVRLDLELVEGRCTREGGCPVETYLLQDVRVEMVSIDW